MTEEDRPQTATPSIQPSVVVVSTSTPLSTPTVVPITQTLSTPQPRVTITAVRGNLYIRRGPDLAYNRIGILKNGESAEVIGQDVLSKWAQINIPNSDVTGWVSLMTNYSEVTGDLSKIPDFTFTDFPLPAYIKNCTEHELYVEPGGFYLYDLYTNADSLNEIRVDSGVYSIYDLALADEPLIQTVDIQEGETAYIMVNGLGEKHKCP